jgi:hypothetical protein
VPELAFQRDPWHVYGRVELAEEQSHIEVVPVPVEVEVAVPAR